MNQPTTSDAASAATAEDQEIRERAKGLTSQVLQQGRVDPDAVREIVRAMMGGTPGTPASSGADAREMFAEAVRTLDEALVKSASETHHALQQLASRGKDFSDNDLKEALVSLRRLEQDYAAAVKPYWRSDDHQPPARNGGACRPRPKCRGRGECPCRRLVGPISRSHRRCTGDGDGSWCERPNDVGF